MIVMAIVAHPTDAFDMVGGTLANHAARGDEVQTSFLHSRVHEDAFRLADRIRTGEARADEATVAAESEHLPVSEYKPRLARELYRDSTARLRFTAPYLGEVMRDARSRKGTVTGDKL
jgi:LmbE family N-acetylglucosaminyl deacetylase